jgi:hypothetical protein
MSQSAHRFTSAEIAISLLLFTGRIEGMALHYNVPLPPPTGPERSTFLHALGTKELLATKSHLSEARNHVGCNIKHHFDSAHAPWWVYPPTTMKSAAHCPNGRSQDATSEALARKALSSAVRSFNLLEDLPEADDAHRLIHESGMFVSRHFSCKIEFQDGLWHWRCPVIISHLRLGQSVGFTAPRVCSICHENIMSERCPHMPNQIYKVTVEDLEHCPCGSTNCTFHKIGDTIKVYPRSLIKEVDNLSEISWVARPRDPLARIITISYTSDQMSLLMHTEIPSTIRTIECLHCRQACTGLWEFDSLKRLLRLLIVYGG